MLNMLSFVVVDDDDGCANFDVHALLGFGDNLGVEVDFGCRT